MQVIRSLIVSLFFLVTLSGVNAMTTQEFESYCDPSLAFEIRMNESFNLQDIEKALEYRSNIPINKYKNDIKIKTNSIKNLIDMCLGRILQKNYNCGNNEALRYQKFIITILPIYDKYEEQNQVCIKYTLLEIYRNLSY